MEGTNEPFAETIHAVLVEYAKSVMGDAINIDGADDVGDDEGDVDDLVKVKVRGMMARLTSVHCVRKEQMNLLKLTFRR